MRVLSIIKYAFMTVGLLLWVGAFFSFTNTQDFLKSAVTTNGTVVELVYSRTSDSGVYYPAVLFQTKDGVSVGFISSSGSKPASYSVGESVEVIYQASSPQEAKINSFFSLWIGTLVLSGMGLVFFLVGFIIVLIGFLRGRKREYLKQNGVQIKAKFKNVEINRSLEVNGSNPYQISAQWINPVTNELHIFKSENIWFDPSDYINADEITVLIEKDNPKKYHVDISFLPKIAQ